MKAGIGCGVIALLMLLIIQIGIYYVSWVLVTTFTDFNTLVSVILALVLGSIIGSLMSGGVRAATN